MDQQLGIETWWLHSYMAASFVRSFVRTFVRSFIRSFRQSVS